MVSAALVLQNDDEQDGDTQSSRTGRDAEDIPRALPGVWSL